MGILPGARLGPMLTRAQGLAEQGADQADEDVEADADEIRRAPGHEGTTGWDEDVSGRQRAEGERQQ
jgi:hypothetical protein